MDGIIIINKEQNWTSNDVVQKVKRITGEKVGHTGTLDPLATGVLPLLIGKGTLLSKYLVNHDKTYVAKVKLGVKTDTADLEGEVIQKIDVDPEVFDEIRVKEVLSGFLGKQNQTPPMYSAIKIKGKKLYEYARKGASFLMLASETPGLMADIDPNKIKEQILAEVVNWTMRVVLKTKIRLNNIRITISMLPKMTIMI